MTRRGLIALVVLALALPQGTGARGRKRDRGDERTDLTLEDYFERREESVGREAYRRALDRLVKGDMQRGMRADHFFQRMGMMVLRNRKGKGVDGFCEGHLQAASLELTRGREPEHYLVFGYYRDAEKKLDPVPKFYVVFRDQRLQELAFFDPADDPAQLTIPRDEDS